MLNIQGIDIFPADHPAIEELSERLEDPSIHGDKIWDASFVMMDFLRKFPLASGSRCLEVGCGWGVLTAYLARHSTGQVTGLDADESVKPYFDLHARQNNVTPCFVKGTMKSMTTDKLRQFDAILGGDICFWDELKTDWQNLIRRALKAGVSQILIVDPGRPPFWELVDYSEKHYGAEIWSHEISEPDEIEQYVLEINS